MHSFLAGWRLSVRRTRNDWPIVAAAWLITLLATMMFAAGPIYSSAAAVAGLRQTLAHAPATDASVHVSQYGTPAELSRVDGEVRADLERALAPLRTEIIRDGRASATLTVRDANGADTDDQAVLGFVDGLDKHTQLISGSWPATTGSAGPLEVVLLHAVAAELGLSVGDELTLAAPNVVERVGVTVRLAGIFTITDAADGFWDGDEQLTRGIVESGGDRVLGPFVTTPEGVLASTALTSIQMRWRAMPNFDGLSVDNVAAVRGRLDALVGRLGSTASGGMSVVTGLPAILAGAERSLLVGRTGMLLVMAQLAILAAYAIALTASLLVDHRRVETALLRSRGAGPLHIAWLALAEGLLLVVPAVIVAPWLAVAEAQILNFAGPLADIGLTIAPTVTADAYLLAGAAGSICLALLVLPAFLAARNLATEERELSRQETRTLGQRLGLDAVLLAVSAIGIWQLRLYGAPLTRSVQGTLGFDPLLVAAPAVGLLAGGILALRVLPLLASAMESLVGRGREVVASLGTRQLARRPLRYTRTALLLILAVSLGVFALSYAETWAGSQEDQATYQAGADVRAVVPNRPSVTPPLPAEYRELPGVHRVLPVERVSSGVSLASGRVDVLLALNADLAGSVVRFRGDEATRPPDELMRTLRDGRPESSLVALPDDAAYLRIDPVLVIRDIVQFPDQGFEEPTPIDPATLADLGMTATAIVGDANGSLYRLSSSPVNVAQEGANIVVPLSAGSRRPDGPLGLAGLEIAVSTPRNSFTTDADVGVAGLSVSPTADGPWTDVTADGWAARMAPARDVLSPVRESNVEGMVVHVDGQDESYLFGGALAGRVLFIAAAINAFDGPVPVLVNRAFLAASGAVEGQTIDTTLEGTRRQLVLAGVLDTFPTTDPARALMIFDGPTLALLRVGPTGAVRNANEWWMAVSPDAAAEVSAALREAPFDSTEVVSAVDRTRSLSTDPVALGILGALLLGFVATGFFALVALVVSATVSARQRRTEFALLRALGLSARQLSGWLWLENGSLVVVSLVAGTLVGVVMSWIALPFITVTQAATTPVPAVLVELPWERILMLDVVVVLALGIAVAILATALRRIGVGTILRMGED